MALEEDSDFEVILVRRYGDKELRVKLKRIGLIKKPVIVSSFEITPFWVDLALIFVNIRVPAKRDRLEVFKSFFPLDPEYPIAADRIESYFLLKFIW